MKCSRCGYDNPSDADRCTACDARLPAAPRPTIVPRERPIKPRRGLERVGDPEPPVIHIPIPPAEPHERVTRHGSRITHHASRVLGIRPQLVGRVLSRQARWDAAPREPGRTILRLALILLVLPLILGACASLTLTLATAALAALCLGMEGLLFCTIPALGLLLALWGLARRPAPAEVPVLELRLEVSPTHQVNVEMIGPRQGGDVLAGDEVALWGKWTRGGTFRAWRARILRAEDQAIRAEVRAPRPYSLPVALAALLVAVLVNVAAVWLLWPRW